MNNVKVLIVEDSPEKASKLKQVIVEVPSISESDIFIVSSALEAKKILTEHSFDLLLLDIQIPNRKGQKIEKNGGVKLWQSISRSSQYIRPAHVIAITSYKEAYQNFSAAFMAESWILIEFNESVSEWEDQIREKVEHVQVWKNQPIGTHSKLRCKVGIVTALPDPELQALLRLPYNWVQHFSKAQNIFYYQGIIALEDNNKSMIVAAVAPQMGMPAACCLTMKIIQEFNPEFVAMVGIAAGLKSSGANYGDVLVCDPCWDWGSGKYAVEEDARVFKPDPSPLRVDPLIIEQCRQIASNEAELARIKGEWPGVKPSTSLNLKIGPVATGAAVVADEEWVKNIQRSSRKLIGIEMEAYGVYYAATHAPLPRPMFVSLKSVCDFADNEKNDKFQHYAAYTSASVLDLLLRRLLS